MRQNSVSFGYAVFFAIKAISKLLPGGRVRSPHNHEESRKEFEKFIFERFGDAVDLRRAKSGDKGYVSWEAAVAWVVWRERSLDHEKTSAGNLA